MGPKQNALCWSLKPSHKWIFFWNISHQAESLLFLHLHASLSDFKSLPATLEMNMLKCNFGKQLQSLKWTFFPLHMHRVISCSSNAEQYQVRNCLRALSLSRQNSISAHHAEYSDQLITIQCAEIMEMLNCKDAIGLIELPANKAIIQFVIAHKRTALQIRSNFEWEERRKMSEFLFRFEGHGQALQSHLYTSLVLSSLNLRSLGQEP